MLMCVLFSNMKRASIFLSTALMLSCSTSQPLLHEEIVQKALPGVLIPPKFVGDDSGFVPQTPTDWLEQLQDPELKTLIDEALGSSPDMRAFAARIEQSEAMVQAINSSFYPSVGATVKEGAKLGLGGSGTSGFYVGAGWEVDLWGRVRAQNESARKSAQAIVFEQESAQLSLIANLTKTLWTARSLSMQLLIAQDIAQSSVALLQYIKHRQKIGIASRNEVQMALANLAVAQEAVENARSSYQKTLMALDMLVGRYPVGTALKSQALPGIPKAYAKGLPSELLERRPDILAAALRLDAARLNIDEAKTARLPKISLSAGFGLIKSSVFVLSTSAANPSLGIGLDVPLFTAGALDQKVKMREAEMDLAYANYAKIGLTAFNEVETALLLEKNWRVRSAELEKAYAIQVLQLSSLEKEQKIGRIDGRAVEQQKAIVLGALSKLEQSKLEILVQRINVYLALGGPVQLIEKEKK